MLLCGEDEVLTILREQAKQAQVTSREMTGVGYFTKFLVPLAVPRLPGCPTFKIGDVNGAADNIKHGLGFLLYVTDGALSMLEGYTYDEPWPNEVHGLTLTYSTEGRRNLDFKRGYRN